MKEAILSIQNKFANFIGELVSSVTRSRMREINLGDRIFKNSVRALGFLLIVLLLAILVFLFKLSWPALHHFGFAQFLETTWNPVGENFGILAFAYGTFVSSCLALLIAVPISVGCALFLNELVPKEISRFISFLIEMLAAIPSVVYGLWGVFVLIPFVRESIQGPLSKYFGFLPIFSGANYGLGMLSASIILSIMIAPTIISVTREVFSAIPKNLREAALGMGATKWEMIKLSVLKTGQSGVFAAVILGFGRALGETMAVTMVIGNRATISPSLFSPAQSMASVIANEYAEATSDLHLSSLALVGLSLLLISLVINGTAKFVIGRIKA